MMVVVSEVRVVYSAGAVEREEREVMVARAERAEAQAETQAEREERAERVGLEVGRAVKAKGAEDSDA